MGKIFYIMGKSASGKDSIYRHLLESEALHLKHIVLYTTRPIRQGEAEGREYYFTDQQKLKELNDAGRIIELRSYDTVYGVWSYFTADDGRIDLEHHNYLGIGTLESYQQLKKYYGETKLCPVYVEVEDGERLKRAICREEKQQTPRYEEMCRRFLADAQDFSEEQIAAAGIERRFINHDRETCLTEIEKYIQDMI